MQLNIIRMYRQLDYFEEYQQRVSILIGVARAKKLVNQALVLITVGGNDFVNNYYLVPYSARSRQYSLQDYVKFLIVEYRKLLMVINNQIYSYLYQTHTMTIINQFSVWQIIAETIWFGSSKSNCDRHWTNGLCSSRIGHAWNKRGMFCRTSTSCITLQPSTNTHDTRTQQENWQRGFYCCKYSTDAQWFR